MSELGNKDWFDMFDPHSLPPEAFPICYRPGVAINTVEGLLIMQNQARHIPQPPKNRPHPRDCFGGLTADIELLRTHLETLYATTD